MQKPKLNYLLGLVLAATTWAGAVSNAQQQADNQAAAAGQATTNNVLAEAPDQVTNAAPSAASGETSGEQGWERGNPLVVIGHDVELKAGDSAEAVVVIGGSAKIYGKVHDAAVVIFGNLEVEGEVGDAAVAVMGNIKLGPNARIRNAAVAVGGTVDADKSAKMGQPPVMVDFPDWIKAWFKHCLLKLRPLAPQVGWVWVIAGVIFLLYLIVAALFPRPVEISVSELSRRPATTFLVGLLAKILAPLVIIILAATVIGAIVVPFVIAALILCALVGKVALLQWLGFKLGRHFGTEGLRNPLLALFLGALVLTVFYIVPVVGFLVFAITAVWGLGAGVTAAFGAFRKELPEKPAEPATSAPMPMQGSPGLGEGQGIAAGGMSGSPGFLEPSPSSFSGTGASEGGTATMTAPAAAPLVMPDTLTYPKGGFWERMAAGFLDFVLVTVIGALAHPIWPLIALAYFTGLWAWKGTTIGGIVLGLKVVRHDGGHVSFLVALVRALAAAFSMIVLFLGFLWIAWDSEKQGWHDKIAGTVVLKLPRGTPLLLF
jgi:uncharacterized RDD family membrane protein YckC